MPAAGPSPARTPALSVVVPIWREVGGHLNKLARLAGQPGVREVILARSGEGEPAPPPAPLRSVRVDEPSRGVQCNAGAALAQGELLVFLHADTSLSAAQVQTLVAAAADPSALWGAFEREFDERHPHLRWLQPVEAWRSRWLGPLFGDQALWVRRSLFERLGGFPPLPLMEDVAFSRTLRRHGRPRLLRPALRTSARRSLARGPWRTTLENGCLIALFFFGASAHRLHRWYYRTGSAAAPPSSPPLSPPTPCATVSPLP